MSSQDTDTDTDTDRRRAYGAAMPKSSCTLAERYKNYQTIDEGFNRLCLQRANHKDVYMIGLCENVNAHPTDKMLSTKRSIAVASRVVYLQQQCYVIR